MRESTATKKWGLRIGITVAVVLLLVVGGPFIYIKFISDEAPKELTLPPAGQSSGSTAPAGNTAGADTSAGLDGKWTVTTGSQAGYRVKEVLFRQNNEAAGRTEKVTGEMTLAGTSVQSANVTVDMTSITSDESRRDGQFHGRIMSTGQFPTSTFSLSQPISVSSLPAENVETKVQANGQLTLRGVTKPVTAELTARRAGPNIQVAGTIPVKFSDYNIPSPSIAGISVQDNGLVEFLLIFAKL